MGHSVQKFKKKNETNNPVEKMIRKKYNIRLMFSQLLGVTIIKAFFVKTKTILIRGINKLYCLECWVFEGIYFS